MSIAGIPRIQRSALALTVSLALITANFAASATEPAARPISQPVPEEAHAASDNISVTESGAVASIAESEVVIPITEKDHVRR